MSLFKVKLRDNTHIKIDAGSQQEALDIAYEEYGEEPLGAEPESSASSEGLISTKAPAGKLNYTAPSNDEWNMPARAEPSNVGKLTPEQVAERKAAREKEFGVVKTQLFPETAQESMADSPYWPRQGLAAARDVFTLPLRLAMPGVDDIGYTQDEAEGLRQTLSSDPTVLPLIGLGAVNLPLRAAGAVAKYGTVPRVLAATGTGAAEGAAGSVASDVVGGRPISPWGVGLGAAGGALLTAPFMAARMARVGGLPPDVGNLAYDASVYRGAAGAKGLDDASEKVLRAAADVDQPHPDVLENVQNQISDALSEAEKRAKDLRRSNRITAADFKSGTEGRQAVIDNLMAEGTWLTPEALMREARRVRSADHELAQKLETIAGGRLWDATHGRALRRVVTGGGDEVEKVYRGALQETSSLPEYRTIRDAQTSGAAASAIYQGLPGGKPAIAGQILEKYLQVPKTAPAAGAAGRTIVPFKRD